MLKNDVKYFNLNCTIAFHYQIFPGTLKINHVFFVLIQLTGIEGKVA